MTTPFSRTLRSVEDDRLGRSVGRAAAAAALVALWCGWAALGRVAVYAETPDARIEAVDAAHPVTTEVDGRVVAVHGDVGREVRAGEVLVELDASDVRANLDAAGARRSSLQAQRDGLVEQLRHVEEARADHDRVASASVAEARAELASAVAESDLAADEAERARALVQERVGAETEATRALALAARSAGAEDAAAHRVERLTWAGRLTRTELLVRQAELEREIALVDAELATTLAEVAVLERELKRRSIAAPVDGTLAERRPLNLGVVLHAGDTVASIVPDGALHVVAQFEPAEVVGRVAPGQPASLHLDGFSWLEFGTVPATVRSVAAEPRDGRIRVELELLDPESGRVPLQHGLPGSLYVEVERISPARLLLRSVLGAGATSGTRFGPGSEPGSE